jgi:hypothetical protein
MMTRRRAAALLTLMLTAGANHLGCAEPPATPTTVTLTIEGMT